MDYVCDAMLRLQLAGFPEIRAAWSRAVGAVRGAIVVLCSKRFDGRAPEVEVSWPVAIENRRRNDLLRLMVLGRVWRSGANHSDRVLKLGEDEVGVR